MFKAYLLSAVVGVASLSPLATFVLPSNKDSGSGKGGSTTTAKDLQVNSKSVTDSSSKNLVASNPKEINETRTEVQQPTQNKPKQEVAPEKTKKPEEVSEEPKKLEESDLKLGLESISPVFKNGGYNKPVTMIASWSSGYEFVILRGYPEEKAFRQLDSDYGIGSNYAGYFTIDKKNSKEQERQKNVTTDSIRQPHCKNLDGGGGQNGGHHTYWKLSRGIKSFDSGKDGNAIASCYKDPVIFLNKDDTIPTFASEKNSRWGSQRISNKVSVIGDHASKKFINVSGKTSSSSLVINTYEDGKKLFNITPKANSSSQK